MRMNSLLAVCNSTKNGSHVLSGVHENPITHFGRRHKAICEELGDLGTAEQIEDDPTKWCKNFLEELEKLMAHQTENAYTTSRVSAIAIAQCSMQSSQESKECDSEKTAWLSETSRPAPPLLTSC